MVTAVLSPVPEPALLLELNFIEFVKWGPSGRLWCTGRISWDGFDDVRIENGVLRGNAWDAPSSSWLRFEVSLPDGAVKGGAESLPDYLR